jgi:hypothetical protein
MFWFLRKRIAVLAEADEFMESFGQSAYQEARYELAKAFERGDIARSWMPKRRLRARVFGVYLCFPRGPIFPPL